MCLITGPPRCHDMWNLLAAIKLYEVHARTDTTIATKVRVFRKHDQGLSEF
jgi:hypothetical protein